MFLFPLGVDVPMQRIPWMNWLLMLLIVFCFVGQSLAPEVAARFILGAAEIIVVTGPTSSVTLHESALSWIGHLFLHAGYSHLIGNLIFMWAFGNAICAKIGNIAYGFTWIGLGVLAAFAHKATSDAPVLGASGAINGIVGLFFVLYPLNGVTMFYFVFLLVRVLTGTFMLSSFWMILLWFGFDLLGFVSDSGNVAYAAHLGGFAGGAILALGLLKLGILESTQYERTLPDVLFRRSASDAPRAASQRIPEPTNPSLAGRKLFVTMPDGKRKHLPVSEFLRHESQGKPVDHFVVSEDGEDWTTFADWRKRHGT